MFDQKINRPHTLHTGNPVPFIVVEKIELVGRGKLADVAPTILQIMGVEKPKAMTGESLIESNVLESRGEIAHNAVMDSAKMKEKRLISFCCNLPVLS